LAAAAGVSLVLKQVPTNSSCRPRPSSDSWCISAALGHTVGEVSTPVTPVTNSTNLDSSPPASGAAQSRFRVVPPSVNLSCFGLIRGADVDTLWRRDDGLGDSYFPRHHCRVHFLDMAAVRIREKVSRGSRTHSISKQQYRKITTRPKQDSQGESCQYEAE
jgi:hypothetical protein